MNDTKMFEDLSRRARAIARGRSVPDVFKSILEASQSAVPRAAIFLVRKNAIQGWGSFGYGTDVAQSQRAYRAGDDQGWLGSVLGDGGDGPLERKAGDSSYDFGQPPAEAAVACPLRIDGRPVALVVAERGPGEDPWLPEALALLAAVAEVRLELDLVRRRAARPADTTTPQPAPGPAQPELHPEPVSDPPQDLEPARRYARLVATDIRLYNEEDVMLGRRNGDLGDRISEHLGRGRETFMQRHAALGPAGIELLHEAYVQVLAAGDASLIPVALLES